MAVDREARERSHSPDAFYAPSLEELVERYGNQWIATARRGCRTAADAEDAYQLALEKLFTQPPAETDPERIAAWMHTVIRNEGMQIIRSRRRELDADFDQIIGGVAGETANPEDALVDAERHEVSKEALKRLRPDQTRCLLLRADGFAYPEICRITGFSYAKVNRLLSEGRKAVVSRRDAIAAGRECQRIEPLLSLVVDDAADAAVIDDVGLHVAHCSHCQATMRDYRLAPKGLAAALPLGVLSASNWRGRMLEPFQRVFEIVHGRAAAAAAGDSSLPVVKKALAVVAVVAATAGGGAVIKHASDRSRRAAGGSTAARSSRLFTPVSISPSERRAARATTHGSAVAGRTAPAGEAAANIARDPNTPQAQRLSDTTADDAATFAADPAGTNGDGSRESTQSGALAP